MDDCLPTYESVTQQDPWKLIAPYLFGGDLYHATLVCRKWHDIFNPYLWGNPALHFCSSWEHTVYGTPYNSTDRLPSQGVDAFLQFHSNIRWQPSVRESVRELTHTLRVPSVEAETYSGPTSNWLLDCLKGLPRLQSLVVSGVHFFDHDTLLMLRPRNVESSPTFGLRFLDASDCLNATSSGLAEALSHFPDLVYLDLSRSPAAKDEAVFNRFRDLWSLRVLKLAGLRLRDSDLSLIADSIGTRVQSLDLCDNKLTDGSAQLLLEGCINTQSVEESRVFETADLERHVRTKLTQGFCQALAVEEAQGVGVTHLYLSGNSMTVKGIRSLMRSNRLQALDIGTLQATSAGFEELASVMAKSTSKHLKYLRVSHTFITGDEAMNHRVPLEDESVRGQPASPPAYGTTESRIPPQLPGHLHPNMLPNLQTLVLTNIPPTTISNSLPHRITQYISACALEWAKAQLNAKHTYMLPPGRRRAVAELEYAHSLFALKRITLEMAPDTKAENRTRSATEDRDSELLWEAASGDFSFFSDSHGPLSAPNRLGASSTKGGRMVDVVAEVSRFRKEKKAAYRNAMLAGATDAFVDGYWPGDVTVVRGASG